MLERWVIASLLIAAIAGARLLLRRHWHPHTASGECEVADTCLTGGCKSLRNLAQQDGSGSCPEEKEDASR